MSRTSAQAIALVLVLVLVAAWLAVGPASLRKESVGGTGAVFTRGATHPEMDRRARTAFPRAGTRSASEVVADRLAVFARKRHETAIRLAERRGVRVPAEAEEFFAAVEAGDWPRAHALYADLHVQKHADNRPRAVELDAVWHAVHETFGVAEVAGTWPAQALIDYGQAIMNAVPPGAIYLGGTDAGRFAPQIFNDAGGADDRIMLTQNSLADATYIEYLNLLHDARIAPLGPEDSERAFSGYMQDAERRARHDASHPEEPREVRPGEVIDLQADGRVSVSGQAAVMAINERLVKALMDRNPDQRFTLEEAFPMKGLHEDSLPLGPVLELRAGAGDDKRVREQAEASVGLWRTTAERFRSEAELPVDSPVRRAWADMAAAQGQYFLDQGLVAQAEETWQRALEIGPGQDKPLFLLVELMLQDQRQQAALEVLDRFLGANPGASRSIGELRRQIADQSGRR